MENHFIKQPTMYGAEIGQINQLDSVLLNLLQVDELISRRIVYHLYEVYINSAPRDETRKLSRSRRDLDDSLSKLCKMSLIREVDGKKISLR